MVLRRKKKKKKIIRKPNNHIEEEYEDYEDQHAAEAEDEYEYVDDEDEDDYEYVDEYETAPKKSKGRAPAEHEESLCVSCGHNSVCAKRSQILEMHTKIKESMRINQRPGYAQFNFRSVVDSCQDFVPHINRNKDHRGNLRYSFNMESDTVTIQEKRKHKKKKTRTEE